MNGFIYAVSQRLAAPCTSQCKCSTVLIELSCCRGMWQVAQKPVNTLCSTRKTEFAWNKALCLLAMRAVIFRSK